jgi:hypothetical protein
MMLMANCKFLKHFNSTDWINNRHQAVCKEITYLLLTKNDHWHVIFPKKDKVA